MKRTFSWVYKTLILIVGVVAMTACSSDEPQDETLKVFPTFEDISAMVGDEGTIDFTAYAVWTISSDRQWLTLSPVTGVAGAQQVKYTVTEDGQGFQDDVATVTFMMDSRPATFKVARTAKNRALTLYTSALNEQGDMELVEVEAIDLIYQSNSGTYTSSFAVKANFDWKLSIPEWISIDPDYLSGDANPDEEKPAYAWFTINYAKASFEDMSGELVFTDLKDITNTFTKDITCPGSKNYMSTTATYEVKLNAEGLYVASSGDSGNTGEVQGVYSFKVTACNDGVMFYKVAKSGGYYGVDMGGYFNYNAFWVQIFENDLETILGPQVKEIGYDLQGAYNSEADREATVLAIPYPIVDANGITGPQDLVASGDQEIKEEYQKFIVTEVIQSGVSSEIAFSLPTPPAGITLEKLEAGNDDYDFIHTEYGVDLVYKMVYNSFEEANNAMLDYKGYSGGGNLVAMYSPTENENTGSSGWISMEINGGKYMTMNITDSNVPFTGERYTWVIVKDQDTYMNEFAIKVIQNVANSPAE